ncbi:MAG: hypothetical protein C5B50_29565 [Verrucomicrobia bacterium]|nr:MAG: hypothetical protein C5B50_29565 [Verrucomicrobiota bacterium]
MKALKGHFDGQHVVLDEPAALQLNTQVTVLPKENWEEDQSHMDFNGLEKEFDELSRKWRADVGPESSFSKITGNLSYLRIISLGKRAVPLILKDLQREPAPWFLALRAITGEERIGKEEAGNFKAMADAWLAWGREHGYI